MPQGTGSGGEKVAMWTIAPLLFILSIFVMGYILGKFINSLFDWDDKEKK